MKNNQGIRYTFLEKGTEKRKILYTTMELIEQGIYTHLFKNKKYELKYRDLFINSKTNDGCYENENHARELKGFLHAREINKEFHIQREELFAFGQKYRMYDTEDIFKTFLLNGVILSMGKDLYKFVE